jgi:hypothetical protein
VGVGSSLETGDDGWNGGPDVGPGAGLGAGGVLPVAASVAFAIALSFASQPGADIGALIEGHRWQGAAGADGCVLITYSFVGGPASTGDLFSATGQPLGAADRALVRQVLDGIEHVSAIRFAEVAESAADRGTLRFGYSQEPNDLGFAGYSFFPSGTQQAGAVWLGQQQAGGDWDFYRPNLVLHETLHALGLKHPFEGAAVMAVADDVIPNTVMSYSVLPGYGYGVLSAYPAEPMAADVAALQAIYGAPESNAGDDVYHLDARAWRDGFHVIYDSRGNDILDASALAAGVSLDLAPGARSDIGVQVAALARQASGALVSATYHDTLTIAAGTTIEHAIGTAGDDVLRGNAGANWLIGAGGNDRLEGRAGDDWLMGGAGSNALDGGTGVDTAIYSGPRESYLVAVSGQQAWVQDLAGGSADVLQGVERAIFRDVTIDLTLVGLPVAAAGWMPAA